MLHFSSPAIGTDGLAAVMERALTVIDSNPSGLASLLPNDLQKLQDMYGRTHCFRLLYSSLVVLSATKPSAPIHILARLWGLSGHRGNGLAKKVCNIFKSFELIEGLKTCEWVDSQDAKMLVLHDLQRVHAAHVCECLGCSGVLLQGEAVSEAAWHKRLLQNYCMEHLNAPLSPEADWSQVMSFTSVTVDWYLVLASTFERHARSAMAANDPFIVQCFPGMQAHFLNSRVAELEKAWVDVVAEEQTLLEMQEQNLLRMEGQNLLETEEQSPAGMEGQNLLQMEEEEVVEVASVNEQDSHFALESADPS